YGRRECGRSPETNAQIQTGAGVEIVGSVRDARAATKHIGLPFDASRRPNRSIEHQMSPARDFALLTSRLRRPLPRLASTPNRPADAETPHLSSVGRGGEAHLREGNAVLRDPSLVRDRGPHFPDRIEIAIRVVVVVEVHVLLNARRVCGGD